MYNYLCCINNNDEYGILAKPNSKKVKRIVCVR